jgi:carbonic anhydrase
MMDVDGDVGGPSFSYNTMSFDGPENWGKLSPAYKECGEGKAQSPIDIVTVDAIPNPSLDNLSRVYAPADATLLNNGKDITLTFDHNGNTVAPGAITVTTPEGAKKTFKFKVIHWHSPSEHTINGQRFPLEVHLVHASEDGHLAVIGILYKIGEPDPFYDQLEEKLRELKTAPRVAAEVVELKSLQKRTGSYFRYMGSLTTPPCTENVIWNILGKVRELSAEQLQLVTAPLPHKDNRPPQPLNGRTVQFYNPPNSTVSFQSI